MSNHVAGETWTFLRRRAGHSAAVAALAVFRSTRVRLVRGQEKLEDAAWTWLARHDDRPYSFDPEAPGPARTSPMADDDILSGPS